MNHNNKEPIVSLQELLDRVPKAVNITADSMEAKGWVTVKLPDDMEILSLKVKSSLMNFFGSEDEKNKNTYRNYLFPHLGFDSDPNRQSLRILTGTELAAQKLPPHFEEEFRKLSAMVDDALLGASRALHKQLFGSSHVGLADLGKAQDLPLLTDSKGGMDAKYGLIEAAYYNNKTVDRAENCAAHYDPGLFSLNVLDTQPGLEFKDEHGNWIEAPQSSKLGILWAGAAASRAGDVKPAIHRVVHPQSVGAPPRLSLWSEICTREQVFIEEVLQTFLGGEVEMAESKLMVQNYVGGEKYVVPVREGGVLQALRIVQEIKGIPMSKSMPRSPVLNDDGEVVGMTSGFHSRRSKRTSD